MLIEKALNTEWLSNTYLVADREGGAAVLIDSGGPIEALLDIVRFRRLDVTHLLNTHHHHDHVAENRRLKEATGARLCAHRLDAPRIDGVDDLLEDGQMIRTGDLEIRVMHIPGHTAGQAAFLLNDRLCFTGDTLFRGSIGGTRAPGHTTFDDLRHSIMERLMTLPDETQVAPGHVDATTIGEERERNPFIRVMRGADPEGVERALYAGREVQLIVWARDYDGGHKAWVRYPDGREDTVPGSQVKRAT